MNYPSDYPKVVTRNPEFRTLIREKLKGQHFMKLFGFELTEIAEGKVIGNLLAEGRHQQQNGFLHGGVISSMADIVMGFAAFSLVPADQHVVTGELRVSYLSPSIFNKVEAIGWVLKPGKKIHFCEAEIWGVQEEKRKLIAKASSVMAVIFPEDFKA